MALTALPQSTVSYNSEEFLLRTLTELFDAGKIDDFRAIRHYGEDGDKDHWHLFMVPSRRLDTTKLRQEFQEVDLTSPGKPLGVLPFRRSSPDDWLMYALHDPGYLRSHSRSDEASHKIQYSLDDIRTPFPEQLQRDFRRAVALRRSENQVIIDALNLGLTLQEIMYTYDINPIKVQAVFRAWRDSKDEEERASYQRAISSRNSPLPIQVSAGALLPEGYGDDDNPFITKGGTDR